MTSLRPLTSFGGNFRSSLSPFSTPSTLLEQNDSQLTMQSQKRLVYPLIGVAVALGGGIIAWQAKVALKKREEEEKLLILAQNPHTPDSLLANLSQMQNPRILRAVVRNPNTSREVLLKLGEKFPEEFWDNPAIPLILLECPAFWREFSKKLVVASLRLKKLTTNAIPHISEDARCEVASNSETPIEILRVLSNDPMEYVRVQVARNPKIPHDELCRLSADESAKVRRAVATNPTVSILILENLSRDREKEVLWEVAQNPVASLELLERLSQDENEGVRAGVAQNVNVSDKILEKLSIDPIEEVRMYVALNHRTSGEVLRKLSEDSNNEVRKSVSQNSKIPLWMRWKLNWELRAA